MRRNGLAGLVAELRGEVGRRRPVEPVTEPEPGAGAIEEEVVTPEALVTPAVIATAEELDAWLTALRERLTEVLKSHKKIRIKERE